MNKKSESGQAIILLVFAVIGLLGFTALAIDGGTIYSDRRHAQSASDAASLSGGGYIALWLENNYIYYDNFNCSDQRVWDVINYGIYKAQERAGDNDYNETEIAVSAVCEDHGPLFDEKYIDITTQITRQSRTALIHFVYDGPATNQVESTVRVRPLAPLALGNAIVALNEDDCVGNQNGVILGGSSGTMVEGGGIFSNGCLRCTGLNQEVECGDNGEFPVCVDPGSISYVGMIENCNSNDLYPNPDQSPDPLPYSSYSIPKPNCDNDDAITITSISHGMTLQSNKLYCITSDNNAIKITNQTLIAEHVTLYLVNGGDIEISGGDVHLTAPLSTPDPSPAIGGVVIYVNPDYESIIKINGNSESSYLGVIYAPSADVDLSGTEDVHNPEAATYFYTQVIGYNVHVTGSAVIDITYEEQDNYPKPAYIDMIK
jgi:hypothetical protein